MYHTCDVGIVGGGLAGTSLAAALARTGASVTLIEATPPRSPTAATQDTRGLALSLASVRILSDLNAWQEIGPSANPIRCIHVSDRGHFGHVRMDAGELGLNVLGYVAAGADILAALMQVAGTSGKFTCLCPARVDTVRQTRDTVHLEVHKEGAMDHVACSLLVVADGAESALRSQLGVPVRRTDYGQTAVVANVRTERPHRDAAFERFTESGPLAMLPLRDGRCSLVMTVPANEAAEVMALDDKSYLARAAARFGRRLGSFLESGDRRAWPLISCVAERQVVDRVVLLGNAAHTIHPNGAQGFNLGLRDAAGLADCVESALGGGIDPGDQSVLEDYVHQRMSDQQWVLQFTEFMATTFTVRRFPMPALRNTAMLLLDSVPALKHGLMRRAAGIAGRQPRAVRTMRT